MQNSMQRHRLIKAMHVEQGRAWTVLAKCAVGLAVIALIAAIGAGDSFDQAAGGSPAAAFTARTGQPAQAHRKQVFDERRARFAGGAGRHRVAGEATEGVDLLPLALR